MTASRTRVRIVAAPLLAGLIALLAASCAPPPAPKPGISFNPPAIGYVGQQYVLKATASNQLPVSFSLDAASTGCSLADGTLSYEAVGSCIVLADQPGDETTPALPQVRRTIAVYDCPTLRSGRWTGPQGTSADIVADGPFFSGTVDLSAFGFGVQVVAGTVTCDLVQMTFNGTPLSGRLSFDGSRITGFLQRHLGGRSAGPGPDSAHTTTERHEFSPAYSASPARVGPVDNSLLPAVRGVRGPVQGPTERGSTRSETRCARRQIDAGRNGHPPCTVVGLPVLCAREERPAAWRMHHDEF